MSSPAQPPSTTDNTTSSTTTTPRDIFAPAPQPPTELGRYRILSPTLAGVRVSPICLGGMSIGSAWSHAMGSMSKESSFALLDYFFDSGGNFIDTSNNYQDEESETWIGEWVSSRQNRDQLVIATKYTSDYRSYSLPTKGKGVNYTGNSRKSLHMSVHESLKKLQTDYLDILYIHWWDYTTSIREIMDSLHILVQQGKVLYLGVSDTPAWVVSAANTYAMEQGKTPFCVYQGRWSLMIRDFEREIIPMARMFGMALCPWDVLGGGKFQTRKQIAEREAKGEGLRAFAGSLPKQTEDETRISEALAEVARQHGIESVTTIALAYVRHKAANVIPIVGGRKVEHLRDNIQALDIELTREQIEFLEGATEKKFDVGFPGNFIGEDPKVTGRSARLERTAWVKFEELRK